MSNGTSAFERFSKLCFQVGKLVMDKKRDAGKVADVLQVILDNPEFAKALPPSNLIPPDGWAAEWRRFYNEVFSLEVDLADVEISPEQPGFGWVVMVAQNLTLNQVWIKCKERFRTYSYVGDDLDDRYPPKTARRPEPMPSVFAIVCKLMRKTKTSQQTLWRNKRLRASHYLSACCLSCGITGGLASILMT